jgi:hypothetical protein
MPKQQKHVWLKSFDRKRGGALRSSLITIENFVINLFKPCKYLLRRWLCFDLIITTPNFSCCHLCFVYFDVKLFPS